MDGSKRRNGEPPRAARDGHHQNIHAAPAGEKRVLWAERAQDTRTALRNPDAASEASWSPTGRPFALG